jgi:hypothetical protein
MKIQGTVSQTLEVSNARAIATGADGRVFWTRLDKDRDFTLKLPTGQSYRIVIANQLSTGAQRVIGRIVLGEGAGKTVWVGANEPTTVDFGMLKVDKLAAAAGSSKTNSWGGGGGGDWGRDDGADDDADDADDSTGAGGPPGGDWGGDHGDDDECHEGRRGGRRGDGNGGGDGDGGGAGAGNGDGDGDGDGDINVCGAADASELTPSRAPGRACEDRGGNRGNGDEDGKPCPAGGTDVDAGEAPPTPEADAG